MNNDTELVIRMHQAEEDLLSAVNSIMANQCLPCFLMEPIFAKVHRQLIDGKSAELKQAQDKKSAKEDDDVNHT